MCYDADARPPLPPIRGAALDARESASEDAWRGMLEFMRIAGPAKA